MKINFVKLLASFGVKLVTGLTGIKAWLVNFILNKVFKVLSVVWKDTMETLKDNKTLKEYIEEIEKPIEEIDKEKRKELENDILTGR